MSSVFNLALSPVEPIFPHTELLAFRSESFRLKTPVLFAVPNLLSITFRLLGPPVLLLLDDPNSSAFLSPDYQEGRVTEQRENATDGEVEAEQQEFIEQFILQK